MKSRKFKLRASKAWGVYNYLGQCLQREASQQKKEALLIHLARLGDKWNFDPTSSDGNASWRR